jgi:dynein heavy chain
MYRDVMRKTRENDNAMRAATTPGYLEKFQKANEQLDYIQKNLEEYLETKRMGFPRFYFLSNDELLEILAETKNVQAVQPHMSKCFDGIKSLDFGEDPKSVDIFAMFSAEGERVPLGKNLKARGNVEQWLTAVEAAMVASLKKQGKESYVSYAKERRTDLVRNQPAQIVIMVAQIYWCRGVIECLESENPVAAMEKYLEKNRSDLKDMTAVVREDLSRLHRKIIAALITIDVHARDIVEELWQEKVESVNDFKWQMQLRYYWDDKDDICFIRQTNTFFKYTYEYLGAQSRLVVTPMTDRCYMTLTGAMHLRLGGAPAGPAGTGKTESTKDLGKALGVQCVVFNCGDNLDYKFMGKFFAGLSQCGAWGCFDEFNRIDIEVLSVVAQQLLTIQNSMKAGLDVMNFEGREMPLKHSFAVFITMNPGYAGRTELPDNLKALFRPMAMMIPDYALVAEVMLFSEGFETSKDLSRKMTKLYKLSSEQLSQQDHYDFGMRALKSLLVMAGGLKRGFPDLDEQVVLIRAMRDANLPKFLSADCELFENLIMDLFPGKVVPEGDAGDLERAIIESINEVDLQPKDTFVTKVVQLYETFNVRFGVMLVGPTGGAKTTNYQILKSAMTKLRDEGHPDDSFQKIHTYVFNPQCFMLVEVF